MNMTYYETVTKLEKMGADKEYVQGWMGGFLHNPKREEQSITDAYTAGYEDGLKSSTDSASKWVKK